MNRRQFLTGASAIAVSAALPAAPVLTDFAAMQPPRFIGMDFGVIPSEVVQWLFYHGRAYWITGEDNVIHWLDPRDVEIA